MSRLRAIFLAPVLFALCGCESDVLSPAGDIAMQQKDILLYSTLLMLLIIVPVMALTVLFAWRYRSGNQDAPYEPEWDHSTVLELVIWSGPLLIIICLGALTWLSTHLLDPYRPLDRISGQQQVAENAKPLEVQVVALDWKWLFFYPKYGIATVNELAAPVDQPIKFNITASSVMNAFYIPALAGQIYAMPGMQTQLYAVANKPGDYVGFSSNYSGSGFSKMRFAFHALDNNGFAKWVATVKQAKHMLDARNYLELEQPSENEPVRYYGAVAPGLYQSILNMCVKPGTMCANEMAAIDAKGGMDIMSAYNVLPRSLTPYPPASTVLGPDKTYVASLCVTKPQVISAQQQEIMRPVNPAPLSGAGLSLFPMTPASAL